MRRVRLGLILTALVLVISLPLAGLAAWLARTRTLAEMHKGTIAVESDGKGAGATFTVRLPLRGADAGTAAPSSPDRPAASPK